MKREKKLQEKNAKVNYKIEMIENKFYLYPLENQYDFKCPITGNRFLPREFIFILLDSEFKGKFVCEYFAIANGFTINKSLYNKLTNGEFAMRYVKESRIMIERIKKSICDIIKRENIEYIIDNTESDDLPF